MEKRDTSILYHGMSGRIGNLVFYQKNGNTFVRPRPSKSKNPPTPARLRKQEKFKRAHAFAHNVINDPELKAVYDARAKPGSCAYLTAVSEFMLTN